MSTFRVASLLQGLSEELRVGERRELDPLGGGHAPHGVRLPQRGHQRARVPAEGARVLCAVASIYE